jgi:sigma-B regulation protein RsbU (phosphoserine phosphatase)
LDGSPVECLTGAGPLIGAFPTLDIPEISTDLAPGDLVLFYTDGVTDARDAAGERFEEQRLFEAVEAVRGGTAQDVVDAVAGAVDRFQGDMEPADDVTIVAIRREPAPSGPAAPRVTSREHEETRRTSPAGRS